MEGAPKRILIVGYSYGSAIASSIVDKLEEIKGFVAIAYPFSVLWFLTLFNGQILAEAKKSEKPKLFIIGDRDNFTGARSFMRTVEGFAEPKEQLVVKGVDHFWFDKEHMLWDAIQTWAAKHGLA
jgi:alpha/beta superfamily hydrolase